MLAQRLEQPLLAWFAEQSEWMNAQPRPVWQETRPEFEGEITLVLFGPAKQAGLSPAVLAELLSDFWPTLRMEDGSPLLSQAHAVGGFLNLSLSQAYWRWRWAQG